LVRRDRGGGGLRHRMRAQRRSTRRAALVAAAALAAGTMAAVAPAALAATPTVVSLTPNGQITLANLESLVNGAATPRDLMHRTARKAQ